MSTETEDERIERLERALRQHSAIHRRRMRWWKHARDYLSLRRLVLGGLVKPSQRRDNAMFVRTEYGDFLYKDERPPAIPDHPPWSSNWWQAERPIRFVRKGRG